MASGCTEIKIKPKNKLPKFEDYKEWLFYENEYYDKTHISKTLRMMDRDYVAATLKILNSEEKIIAMLPDILDVLCMDLSKRNFEDIRDYLPKSNI